MDKEQFLNMLKQCIQDGNIRFDLDTALSQDWRNCYLNLDISIKMNPDDLEEDYYNTTIAYIEKGKL